LNFEGATPSNEPPHLVIKRKVELVVFRIDTSRYPLRVMTARQVLGVKKTRLAAVHKKVGALLTINGGYFSKEGDPMGLVISNGKLRHSWSDKGGSGALAVFGSAPRIDWARNVAKADPPPTEALQNGPLMIEPDGKFGMTHRRDKYFPRTVVALDKGGRLLVGVVRKIYGKENIYTGLNLMETAVIFYNPPTVGGLGAVVAMNLDGGTSTGMKLTLGSHTDRVPVSIKMPTFVCIMPAKAGAKQD